MSVAGTMFLIALSLGVITFIAWPLITQPPSNASQIGDNIQGSRSELAQLAAKLAQLESTYDQTLISVRDLDFDFQTGKLLTEDHRQQRAVLMVTAADLLRQIDQVKSDTVEAAVTQRRIRRAVAQQAEAAITQKRAQVKKPKS